MNLLNRIPSGLCVSLLLLSSSASAQLAPPQDPVGNPSTTEKVLLGKALFWDEQLSSNNTVACGTCHKPEHGGADPRAFLEYDSSINPGPDGVFGNQDDVHGSRGVIRHLADGRLSKDPIFGLKRQVTARHAPSSIGAGYTTELFWDGAATEELVDPVTGQVVLAAGAALESQALMPFVNSGEMGHLTRSWSEVIDAIESITPLALAESIPNDLSSWIAGRDYAALYADAFGSTEVSASRTAMAIAAYERSQVPNQTPYDQILSGVPAAQVLSPLELQGMELFFDSDATNCIVCHTDGVGNVRLTDDLYHYIGARPRQDDRGRMYVTGQILDSGKMRTPDLRNVELSAPYMHSGSIRTLEEVVEFYDRGGDFTASNKHVAMVPLNLTIQEKQALVAFLKRPLTDPRVAAASAPFDRPALYTDSAHVPDVFGVGTAGTGGFVPEILALEPPQIGQAQVTVGIDGGLGGSRGLLVSNTTEQPGGAIFNGVRLYPHLTNIQYEVMPPLHGIGPGAGWGSKTLHVPTEAGWQGTPIVLQCVLIDPGATTGRWSASNAVRWTWY